MKNLIKTILGRVFTINVWQSFYDGTTRVGVSVFGVRILNYRVDTLDRKYQITQVFYEKEI